MVADRGKRHTGDQLLHGDSADVNDRTSSAHHDACALPRDEKKDTLCSHAQNPHNPTQNDAPTQSSPPALPSRSRRRSNMFNKNLSGALANSNPISNRRSMILPQMTHFAADMRLDQVSENAHVSGGQSSLTQTSQNVSAHKEDTVEPKTSIDIAKQRRRHTLAIHTTRIHTIENDTLMLMPTEDTPTRVLERFSEIERLEDLPVQFFKSKKLAASPSTNVHIPTTKDEPLPGNCAQSSSSQLGELGTEMHQDHHIGKHADREENELITSITDSLHKHTHRPRKFSQPESLAASSEHSYSDSESSLSSSELQNMESLLPPTIAETLDSNEHDDTLAAASPKSSDKFSQYLRLKEEIHEIKKTVKHKRKQVSLFMENLQQIEFKELERKRKCEERILFERLSAEIRLLRHVLLQKQSQQRSSDEHFELQQQKVTQKRAIIQQQQSRIDTLHQETQKLTQMLNLERQKKSHDLFHNIYPIQSKEQTGGLRKILGMTIYRGESVLSGNDTSTALGCVAHCMSLLSEIYNVPLLYEVRFVSSRSMIYDNSPQAQSQQVGTKWLPLYAASAKEKPRFLRAVHLLLCNVRHFMSCVGMN
eukprot:CAMPEP_0117440852 /NCGR_PEP_ID=MMETSP0759-20121206/3310_1 /TAXON_ID=63605 /ORGANISM="Percolomonas cosmopolitus, Strain WS" /LENGTH=592 /DNA_ID=CAMNT_0005232643 /DNA_START=273 /DNA_END=2048 /DNA_ORIENTATION=+